MSEITEIVPERAIIEVVNFEGQLSWIRWYLPDWSNNGNIDLPPNKNFKLKSRVGERVTVEEI